MELRGVVGPNGISANRERHDRLGNAEIVAETNMLFASGSTAIAADGRAGLLDLAAKALTPRGRGVDVTGFADAIGDPVRNKALSAQRI